jgi:hypothetical protein
VSIELELCSEMAVIEGVVAWGSTHPQARSQDMVNLLCDPVCVRLSLAPKHSVRAFARRMAENHGNFDQMQMKLLLAYYDAWLDGPLPLVVDRKCPFMSCNGALGEANMTRGDTVRECISPLLCIGIYWRKCMI